MNNFLSVHNISKAYDGHLALNDVSFEVPEQSIFGLLGPNGAGKTSLIRIINQIITADRGTIALNGKKMQPDDVSQIGYLPEERGLYKKMKVAEQLLYLAQLKGMSKKEAKYSIDEWFERLDISSWWDKKVEDLSKGMAQKVQFVSTVLHRPKLLILDEPFSGFDPINSNLIKSEILRLREEGATIILSTHNMGSVEEICENIALIDQSRKVLGGAMKTIKEEHRSFTYEVKFKGNIIGFTNALWTGFELLEQQSIGKEHHTATIKLLQSNTLNDLLSAIIPHVLVEEVKEIVPSMDEIFINTVTPKKDIV